MATHIHSYRTYLKTMLRYHEYSSKELKNIILASIIFGFIFSFKDWGAETFDISQGLINLLWSSLAAALTFFLHISTQKMVGGRFGYKVEYKSWTWGIIIAIILAFVSQGNLWFIAPGGIIVHHIAKQRLGYFRYETNLHSVSLIAVSGAAVSLFLAAFLKTTNFLQFSDYFIPKLIMINLFYAFFSILPIPPLNGIHILYDSRAVYVFVLAFFILMTIVIHFFGFFASLFITLILASAIWFMVWSMYEDHV